MSKECNSPAGPREVSVYFIEAAAFAGVEIPHVTWKLLKYRLTSSHIKRGDKRITPGNSIWRRTEKDSGMFGRGELNCRKLEGLKFRATPPATPH
ncbi:hypothetical protein CEXT_525741 [Caerostris extrusa]|uniref:Uncharacterized protein n=1 Tax=Caerostris extrusa TaxID=172846 RepID=A0AAV4MV47_CAEEX|nr:hypothetical protein CEXT_525741 [Caerostris extrusa]